MSYEKALKAAGAEVLEFESFGSYQGDWWAVCRYNGDIGWVTGSFGSCSGCDAYKAEFGWSDEEDPDYQDRLAAFGLGYLDPLITQQKAVELASENLDWDDGAKETVEFVTKAGVKHAIG